MTVPLSPGLSIRTEAFALVPPGSATAAASLPWLPAVLLWLTAPSSPALSTRTETLTLAVPGWEAPAAGSPAPPAP